LAGPRDRLHAVVLGGNGAASRQALSRQLERAHLANVSLERCSDLAGLRHTLAQLNPGLVAIETAALERAQLRALVADTRCDLLLVGKA